jgi:hypothetical protein
MAMALALYQARGSRIGCPGPTSQKEDCMTTPQQEQHLGHLPGHVLFDLARNEAAPSEWRKAAAEFLLDGNHRQATNADIRELILQIKAERLAKKEVAAIVETAVEAEVVFEPKPEEKPNALNRARDTGSNRSSARL